MLEHKAVCTVIDGHHKAAENKAPALAQKGAPLCRRNMQTGTAPPLVQPQKYNGCYGIIDCVGDGKPANVLAQNQKEYFVERDDDIPNRCGNRCVFGLQPTLKPVLNGIKRLKDQGHAVKRYHGHGQALSTVHSGHYGQNADRRQRTGQQPHCDRRSNCSSGTLRVIHKVLQKE